MFNKFFDRFRKHNQTAQDAGLHNRPTRPVVSVNAAPTEIAPQPEGEHNRRCVSDGVVDGIPPERLALIQKMGQNVHLVMRMAAMRMLRPEGGGYVMELDGEVTRMPDASTLFEAYLVLEGMYGLDWADIDEALKGPWASEVLRMVIEREAYLPVWNDLRGRVAGEALEILKKHDDGTPDQRSAQLFTLLAINACDKIIGALGRRERQHVN